MRELRLDPADPLPDPDTLRRLYLRGVRKRRPEVDPEGFQRLRQAYELLQQPLFPQIVELPGVVGESIAPAAAPQEAPRPAAPASASAPAPATPPSGAEPGSTEPQAAESGGAEAKVNGAEPAISPAAESAPPATDEQGSAELYKMLRKSLVTQALPGTQPPPVSLILQEIAHLYRDGMINSAQELAAALRTCLTGRGDEKDLIHKQLATRWLLLSELEATLPYLPVGAVRAIALGITAGDLDHAVPPLRAVVDAKDGLAESTAAVLQQKAPTLAAALIPALFPPNPATPPQSALLIPWQAMFWLVTLLSVFSSSFMPCLLRSGPTIPAPSPTAAPPVLATAQEQGHGHDSAVAGLARNLERRAREHGATKVAQGAQQLSDQATTHRCETVLVLKDNLRRDLRKLELPVQTFLEPDLGALEAKIAVACTPLRMQADTLEKWSQP